MVPRLPFIPHCRNPTGVPCAASGGDRPCLSVFPPPSPRAEMPPSRNLLATKKSVLRFQRRAPSPPRIRKGAFGKKHARSRKLSEGLDDPPFRAPKEKNRGVVPSGGGPTQHGPDPAPWARGAGKGYILMSGPQRDEPSLPPKPTFGPKHGWEGWGAPSPNRGKKRAGNLLYCDSSP